MFGAQGVAAYEQVQAYTSPANILVQIGRALLQQVQRGTPQGLERASLAVEQLSCLAEAAEAQPLIAAYDDLRLSLLRATLNRKHLPVAQTKAQGLLRLFLSLSQGGASSPRAAFGKLAA